MARRGEREYDEFTNSGADANRLSDADYDAMGENKNAFEAAQKAGNQEGMSAAHDAAEALREKYGYSGGADGGGYAPVARKEAPEFSYQNAPAYASKYQSQIDGALQMLLNRDKFSYDYTKDPRYKQYERAYTENGKRAMEDTLAQVSARTGGLASSYAGAASQQSYNRHMDALSAKIPELEQLAYSMYRDEGNDQRANLDMLQALESGDYNKYLGLLGQYNSDRNFNYGIYNDDRNLGYQTQRDEVSDGRYENEWDYNMGRDEISDKRYEDETAYEKDQTEKKWAWDEGGRAYDREQDALALQAKASGGGTSGNAYKPKLSAGQAMDAVKNGITSQSVLADYEYWFGGPYTQKYGTENAAEASYFNRLKSKAMGFRSSAGQADQISLAVENKEISEEQAVELFHYFKIPLE